jgi:hypothetical protein
MRIRLQVHEFRKLGREARIDLSDVNSGASIARCDDVRKPLAHFTASRSNHGMNLYAGKDIP